MRVRGWPPIDMARPLANSMVSVRAAWATPSIIAGIQDLDLEGTRRASGALGSHGSWGAGRLFKRACASGVNTSSKNTSLLMEALTAMACQVGSTRTPGVFGLTSIQRLWSLGGSTAPSGGCQSGGGPGTWVLRKSQPALFEPLMKGQRPVETNPPSTTLVVPQGIAAWAMKAPSLTTDWM